VCALPDLQTARTVEKGHGRIETRELAATSELSGYLDWPGAAQVCRIQRSREIGTKCSQETVYAITSLPRERTSAEDLLALNRQHWAIENRLHWLRDTVFGEDRSPIRSTYAPRALPRLAA
jgi:Transposase DDE domain